MDPYPPSTVVFNSNHSQVGCHFPQPNKRVKACLWRLGSVFLLTLTALLVAFLALLGLPHSLWAAGPLYVAPSGSDSGNCTLAAPCRTIQRAVDVSLAGGSDEIRVAAGSYPTVTLYGNLTLRGGFTTTNWLTPNPQQNLTVIDAQGSGRALQVNGSVTALVSGFDLTGGNVTSNGGAGVYNNGTLTLDRCRIYGNRDGGGNGGGGIANNIGARLVLKNSQVYSNTSNSGDAGMGGGIAIFGGTALLEGNEIFSNTVADFGGGIYVSNDGAATLKSNLIYNNAAVVDGEGYGGGIFVIGSTTLENNTLYKNAADSSGGGIYVYLGTMAITNSLIISNTAPLTGGITNDGSTVSVAYTDFRYNSPNDGFTSGTGNRTDQNPQFVDPANYNLHLAVGSPAIDSGLAAPSVTSDYEGEGRPFGLGIDRGADEFTTASACYARVLQTGQVYTDLPAAISAATAGNTVQVAGRCQPISLAKSLTVRGGYTATDWLNARYGPTILDAGGAGRVVAVTGAAAVTLENLHLTSGSVTGDGAGVYLDTSGLSTLRNNVIYANSASDTGGGVFNSGRGNAVLQHNTLYGNTAGSQGGGVYASSSNGSGIVTLSSNIIANSNLYGLASLDNRFNSDYNYFYNNTGGPINGPSSLGAHDLLGTVAPGFVNPGGADFHLQYTSPLIDAADPASGVSTDFEDDTRPQGARPDIGADESAAHPGVDLSEASNPQAGLVTDIGAVLGRPITFSHTITNTGSDPGLSNTFVLAVTNSQGWPVSLVGISTPTVVLASGASQTFDVVVSVPITITGGIYNQTSITVAAQNNPAVYDTATDLISSPGAQLVPNYDQSAQPGEILTYTHILTNVGPVEDAFNLQLTSTRGWGQLVGVTSPITLPAGGSTLITVSVYVTDTAPANIFDVSTLRATSVNYGVSATAVDTTTAKATIGDRYVVATGGRNTDNNCTQSASPCATIGYAIGQAAFSDTVKVAGGNYFETGLIIQEYIKLRGGFTTGNWTTPNPAVYTTTIDAQRNGQPLLINVDRGPNFRPVVEGFTIRNGTGGGGNGGAIYVQGTSAPTLSQLIILDSSAPRGGGIYLENGNTVLQGITISNTTASVYGGGIYQAGGTVTITATRITNARAGNSGGGLYSGGGTLNLWNNFIDHNTATSGGGGGVYKSGGVLSLVNDTIVSNRAATTGGGIAVVSSSGIISNTIVVSNTAATGGGIYRSGSSPAANYNDVWNNTGGNYSGLTAGANDISANPLFVDEANGDLHLTSASPATDRGDPNTFLKSDFDHNRRPANQGYDLGADELQGCLARIEGAPTIYDILQQAVDLAPNGGAVQISGICLGAKARLVNGQTLTQTVVVTKNLALKGGYDSTFSNDPNTHPELTILDALSQGRTLLVTNSVAVTLSHLTLNGGNGAAGGGNNAGGGIYNGGARLTVETSVISGNQAAAGGGLYLLTGTLTLGGMNAATATQVFSNTATDGGGLYVQAGSALITHTFFASNTATRGGGLYNSGGLVTAQIVSATHNSAADGGAFYNAAGGGLTLVNALVFSNTATNGGGLYNLSEALAVRHDTFFANNAGNWGGAIYHDADTTAPVINSTLLVSNTAVSAGSAIYNASTAPSFQYNDLFNNDPAYLSPDGTNLAVSPNLLSVDPAQPTFLHLAGGSPVEDRGDPASPVNLDYDKDPRPSNQNFDIGADEVGGCYVRVNEGTTTYGNIMTAIGTLSAGSTISDVVKVAGTCQGVQPVMDGGQTVSQTVFLTRSLTLQGGYNKDNWQTPPDPAVYTTTLDALNLGRVVYVTNSAVISMGGFHIRQGMAANGGAVFVGGGVITLSQSSIYSSTATNGGVGYNAGGTFVLDGNQIYANQAGSGGAFYHAAGESTLQNNIIRDNTATDGGGVYNDGSGLLVRHNTVYSNSATNNGGGFYTTNTNPVVVNNIFANNNAATGHAMYSEQAGFLPTYNDAYPAGPNPYGGGAAAGSGSLTLDPGLVDPDFGDFHLSSDSLVLDMGDPAMTLYYDFESDYRPSDQGFDMGADEQASCRARIMRGGLQVGPIYGNIQRAVNNSISNDTIQVSVGECRGVHTYVTGGQTFSQTVHIVHNLTLHGGFSTDFTSGGTSGPSTYPDDNASTINPTNLGRAVLVTDSASITMYRFILVNGNANAGGGGSGGGLYFNGSRGRIEHVDFYSNTATLGGGFFNAGANFEMFNSWIHNNSAADGGAVYNATGVMTITGEIDPDPSLDENTVMESNWATNRGGAIFNDSGTLWLLDNSYIEASTYNPLSLNQATYGGFAYNNTGRMILENNAISNNRANQGGAIYNNTGALSLDRGNRLYRNQTNTTAGLGGAIYNNGGTFTAWNTFIYGNNNTYRGVGLYLASGNPSILHNTFYLNEAANRGGGIYVGGGSPTIWANIFDQQTAPSGGGSAIYADSGSLDYNDYWNNSSAPVAGTVISGTHNFNVIPNFVGESISGGADFHLAEESALIDVGPYPDLNVPHDFEDDPRPINTYPDIGADEYNACLARLASNSQIYGTIQDAVNDANTSDTIDVAEGVCEESVTIANKNLTIQGSWRKDFSSRYVPGVISTTIKAPTVISNRVMAVQGTVNSFDLSQIELISGTINGNGGGLYLGNGVSGIHLQYVDIKYNQAENGGGVYAGSNVTARFDNVKISYNRATAASGNGGGIYVGSSSNVDLWNSGAYYNEALNGNGGGMYNDALSDIYVTGGSDEGNRARNGGGFYNHNATFEVKNKWFLDNEATTGDGGAVYADSTSSLKITNLLLYDNSAAGNGGGVYNASTGAAIYHSTINKNLAVGQGGGVYNTGSSMVISASIVSFNTSGGANGIHNTSTDWVDVGRTLRSADTTYNNVNESNGSVGNPNYLISSLLPLAPEGAYLHYTSPAIDAVPTVESDVDGDAYLTTRPQICAKDMGLEEYYVGARTLTWGNPPTSTVTISPTESVTYTFVLTNNSEKWIPLDATDHLELDPGTGYTETITITINSTQPWGQQFVAISGGFNPTIITNTVATVTLGPGQAVIMEVRVTVPPGTFADVVDVTTLSLQSVQGSGCNLITPAGSGPATTRVLQSRKFIIAPDRFGAARPGETITYTHLITNLGNLTDTYLIYPAAPLYASGEIVYPLGPTFTVTLGPLQSSPITMLVTVDSRAAGGLLGRTNATGQSLGDPTLIEAALDTTAISYTTGTRHVSLDGLDKFEPNGPTDKDNNCRQGDITPCRTIQQAINQAAAGDLIKIEQGVYSQVYSDILTTTYKGEELTQIAFIDKSITLQGGYEKDIAGGWDENPPNHVVQTTTLNLGGAGRGVFVTEGVTATVNRLTIVNGQAAEGGAIYNEGGNLTLSGLALTANSAQRGASLYSGGGDLVLQNSLLYRNQATGRGGAVYINAGTARLQHDTFYDNEANQGGAAYINGGNFTVTNTIFATNTGSALYLSASAIANPATDYNLYYGNVITNYVVNGVSTTPPGNITTNVFADPMFVDPTGDPPDLNLQRGSPAIERNDAGLPIDYANTPRPQDARYDLGAYERMVVRGLLFYSDTVTSTMAGAPVVVTHILSNTGELTETVTITASSTLPWVVDFDQSLPYVITLPSMVSRTVVVTYQAGSAGQSNTTVITATASLTSLTRMVTDVINVRSVNWQIDKTVTPTPTVQPGAFLTYTLTLTNVGDIDSQGSFTVTDELPNETHFVSAGGGGVLVGSTVQWVTNTTVLSNNGSLSFSYVVTVTRPLTDGALIVNQAYGASGGGAPNPATGSSVTVTVTAPVTVTISKAASPSPVQPGDILTYTLTVTNEAESFGPALNPLITDPLPPEVVPLVWGFVPPADGVTSLAGPNAVRWNLAQSIWPGASAQVTVTVRVTSPLAANTVLTNSYGLSVSNIVTPVIGLLTTPVTATNAISLQKTVVPTQTGPGGIVTYTIILSNSGNGLATVSLTDTLAAGFTPATYNTGVVVPGRTWSTTTGSASVSFTATVPITAGVYSNTLVTAAYDLTGTTLGATAPVTVETPLAGLSLSKTPDLQLVQPGGTAVFTFTLVNTGNVALNPITITDPSAAGCERTTVGTLAVSATTSYTCTESNVTAGFTNIATATSTGVLGSQPVTATDTATVTVINPALDIDKTPETQPARSGDTVTFTITVSNTGDITLTNVTVSDVQATGCNHSVGTLAAGSPPSSYTCTMIATADLTNTATVTGAPPAGPDVSASDDAFVNVINPTLQIGKTPDVQYALSGDTVTFTITVSNTGDITLTNVTVNDDQAANCDDRNLGDLAANTGDSYTCTLTVNADLTNTASVTGTPPLGSDVSASDDAFVDVISPAITIAKTPDLQTAQRGDPVTFTITVSNTGDGPLNNVVVGDALTSDCNRTIGVLATGVFTSYTCSQPSATNSFTNTAVVTGTPPAGPDVTANDEARVNVVGPNLEISKLPASQDIVSGSLITFTIIVTNTGDVTMTTVEITDEAEPACNQNFTDVYSGTSRSYECPIGAVTADLTNTVVATGTPETGRPVIVSATATVNVAEPGISIAKTPDSQYVLYGGTAAFTITVVNTGDVYLSPITVTDALAPNCNGVYSTLFPLLPGLRLTPPACTLAGVTADFTNTVIVTAGTTISTEISAADDAFVDVITPALTIAKTPLTQVVQSGSSAVFTITVTNSGDITLTNIRVDDTAVPACNRNIGPLAAGATYPYTCTQPNVPVAFTNIATASGDSPVNSVITTSNLATVTVITPALAVFKMPDFQAANNGDTVTFTITVSNTGDVTLAPITVTDALAPDCNRVITAGLTAESLSTYNCTMEAGATDITNIAVATGVPPAGPVVAASDTAFVDTTPPARPRLVSPANLSYTNNPAVTFSWSPAADTVTYTLWVSGATYEVLTPTTSYLLPGLADGVYTWTVRSVDAYSRTLGYTDSWRVTVDTTPPASPTLITPTNGMTVTDQPTFDWSDVTDALSGPVTYTITISGVGVFTSSTSSFTPSGTLPPGVYTWTVRAYDQAGNASVPSVEFTFTVEASTHLVYLPIIVGGGTGALPDLRPIQLTVQPATGLGPNTPVVLSVVVQNVGTATAPANFWVDFYINPPAFPTEAGHLWGQVCPSCYGLAWQVRRTLAPGESVTLTSAPGDPYLVSAQTRWLGYFNQGGTQRLGVYVDSWDGANKPQGFILESSETNNLLTRSDVVVTGAAVNGLDQNEFEPMPDRPRPER